QSCLWTAQRQDWNPVPRGRAKQRRHSVAENNHSTASTYRPFLLLGTVALVLAILYWAREVLVPVALAVLLAFVLTPAVNFLQRRGLPRVLAVVVVVFFAFGLLGGLGLTLTWELRSLAHELPGYSDNVEQKVTALRNATRGTFLEGFKGTLDDVTQALQPGAA